MTVWSIVVKKKNQKHKGSVQRLFRFAEQYSETGGIEQQGMNANLRSLVAPKGRWRYAYMYIIYI